VVGGAYLGRWLDARHVGGGQSWTLTLILLGLGVGSTTSGSITGGGLGSEAGGRLPETAFTVGPVRVTDTVVYTWIVMAAIILAAFLATRRLAVRPTRVQGLLEAMHAAIEGTVREILPVESPLVVPVLGTLWLFIGVANLAGLVPGMRTPTADLNTTFALALVSYAMTHVVGIGAQGLRGTSRTTPNRRGCCCVSPDRGSHPDVALAIRLFGNMLSGELVAVIVLGIAGLLVPVPFACCTS